MALSAHALIRGWDVTYGLFLLGWQGWGKGKRLGPDVAASLAAEGWAAESLPCLQHPDQVLKAGFSSPLALCLASAFIPSRAAALLLTLSASPGAARCWSALVLPVPKPKPSPPAAAQTWDPLPWRCLSSTPPSPLFCLKHFNVTGQQLRGCPDPFLEALSTF